MLARNFRISIPAHKIQPPARYGDYAGIPLPNRRGIVLQTHYEIRTSFPVVLRFSITGAVVSRYARAGSLCGGAGLRVGLAGRAALHFRSLDPLGAPVISSGSG